MSFVGGIGKGHRNRTSLVKKNDLQKQQQTLQTEGEFLKQGLEETRTTYNQKRTQVNISEESLFAIAWDLEGYSKLIEINTAMTNTISNLLVRMAGGAQAPAAGDQSIPATLSKLRKDLGEYEKGLYVKKREAASHLLLFMISDEQRSHKPYAIPVRVLKYKSISDAKLRELKRLCL